MQLLLLQVVNCCLFNIQLPLLGSMRWGSFLFSHSSDRGTFGCILLKQIVFCRISSKHALCTHVEVEQGSNFPSWWSGQESMVYVFHVIVSRSSFFSSSYFIIWQKHEFATTDLEKYWVMSSLMTLHTDKQIISKTAMLLLWHDITFFCHFWMLMIPFSVANSRINPYNGFLSFVFYFTFWEGLGSSTLIWFCKNFERTLPLVQYLNLFILFQSIQPNYSSFQFYKLM